MKLYIFYNADTGVKEYPFLADNDEEAVRIACMAFANVPEQTLRALTLNRVVSYGRRGFSSLPLYSGVEYIDA